MIHIPYQPRLPDANSKQIKGRCSHGRGAVLQHVRPIVDGLFNMNTKNPGVVRKNAALAKKLLSDNAFYFVVRVPIA